MGVILLFSEERKAFNYKTGNNQDRGDGYSRCAVNLVRMKLVRIITFATYHQQQPNCHDHNAAQHP